MNRTVWRWKTNPIRADVRFHKQLCGGGSSHLWELGEGSSEYLLRLDGCRSPSSLEGGSSVLCVGVNVPFFSGPPPPHSESDTTALALAFSFSRSVWLTGAHPPVLARWELFTLPGSFSLDGAGTVFRPCRPASMLLLMGRAPVRPPVKLKVLDLAGLGRLRYCMLLRAFGAKKLWSQFDTSRLVLRPPPTPPAEGFTGIPEVLGVLLTITECSETVFPLVVSTVAVPIVGTVFL